MNRRFFLGWVAVFVAWMAGDFVVHGTLLHADYQSLSGLYRAEPDAERYFPLLILAHVVMAGAFAWIYSRGVESKPWLAQGIRFGIAAALLLMPMYLIYYVVQPMSAALAVKQMVYGGIVTVILGAVAAFVYRSKPAAA